MIGDLRPKIVVIDGQGGRIGKQLIESMKECFKDDIMIIAIGTNSIATANMIKAGADEGATGENPVIVACKKADIILGPIGVVVADSLLGEVTEKMAVAVGKSQAVKLLIPINKCDNIVVGISDCSITELIQYTIDKLREILFEK